MIVQHGIEDMAGAIFARRPNPVKLCNGPISESELSSRSNEFPQIKTAEVPLTAHGNAPINIGNGH
jgi:hypothetical protein